MYGATTGQVGFLTFPASTNQAVCAILPNDKIIPEFLYFLLKSQKDALISLSTGGAQQNISQKIIKDFKIPLPSLANQKRIVASLDEEQKIIEANKRLIEMMKRKIEGVMENLLCR